jgi:lipoyl(octanoyl) transferase
VVSKPFSDLARSVAAPLDAVRTPRPDASGDAHPLVARSIEVTWLGREAYRPVWELQKRLAAARADGAIDDQLLLVEHDRVLTLGRHAEEGHVRVTAEALDADGIELLRVERGGEVTYHGPGQLVAYPILALAPRGLLLRPLVRALEAAMVETCRHFGVDASRRDGHPGCWVDPEGPRPRKIGALGIRVERGVTYHGIALNVDPDLREFDLIDACGMPDVVSTSIAVELAAARANAADAADAGRPTAASSDQVEEAGRVFAASLATGLGATLATGHATVDAVELEPGLIRAR